MSHHPISGETSDEKADLTALLCMFSDLSDRGILGFWSEVTLCNHALLASIADHATVLAAAVMNQLCKQMEKTLTRRKKPSENTTIQVVLETYHTHDAPCEFLRSTCHADIALNIQACQADH